jgi:hypothetical protein
MARTLAEAVGREEPRPDEDPVIRKIREWTERMQREGLPADRTPARLDRIEADIATLKQELVAIREAVLSLAEQGSREEE